MMIPGKEEGFGYRMFVPLIVFVLVTLAGMYVISNQVKPQNFYVNQEPPKNTISTQGEAKTRVTPNLVQISFTIETNDTSSARIAQDKNGDITDRVKKQLISAGLNEPDITTVQFTVEPIKKTHWVCPDPQDKKCDYYDRIYSDEIIGYKATHNILVKSEDTKKAGALLDAINNVGGNNVKVDYVSFSLKDETKKQLEKDLLEKASQNAKDRAQKIASGVGVSLGKPMSLSESVEYPIYYNRNYAPEAAAGYISETTRSAGTQVFGGQVDVTAKVSATFEVN